MEVRLCCAAKVCRIAVLASCMTLQGGIVAEYSGEWAISIMAMLACKL